MRGIITAVTGLIAAIGAVVGVLVGVGILPPGGSPAPTSAPSAPNRLPSSDAVQPAAAFHELQIRADPPGAGSFVLNPNPNAQGRYSEGTRVTIDVLPQQGWQVEKWIGPVEDESGLSAKIDMHSGQTVVVVFTEGTPGIGKNEVFPNSVVSSTSAPVPFNGQTIPEPPLSRTDVTGEWVDVLGNTLTFRGMPPDYEFTQRSALGDVMAEGTAFFSEGLLVIDGVNVLGLSFSGLFEVTERHMVGNTINALGEENFLELFR